MTDTQILDAIERYLISMAGQTASASIKVRVDKRGGRPRWRVGNHCEAFSLREALEELAK